MDVENPVDETTKLTADAVNAHVSEEAALDPAFESRLRRFFEATGAKKNIDLARILEIQSGSFSTALKRGVIPPGWYFILADKLGISIDWLYTGEGRMLRSDRNRGQGVWLEVQWVAQTFERLGGTPLEVRKALTLALEIAARQGREDISAPEHSVPEK